MTMDNLIKFEKDKYDLIHKAMGGYGYQTVRIDRMDKETTEFNLKVHSIFAAEKTALDVGCGKGNFYEYFTNKYGIKIVGLDISDIAVKSCIEKGYECIQGSADDILFPDKSFDIVFHFDGMEHIPREIEDKVLSEQCRVAKKYVILLIARLPAPEDAYTMREKKSPVHINLKQHKDWIDFYNNNAKKNNYKIILIDDKHAQTCVILEKI